MSDYKAKMHQIRFRLGLCPRPAGGAYSALPDPLLAGFKGPTSKGLGGEGRRERERAADGRESRPPPFQIPASATGVQYRRAVNMQWRETPLNHCFQK